MNAMIRRYKVGLVVSMLCIAAFGTESSAQMRDDGAPAAALGMADSVTGNATGTNAMYFNPAGMSRIKQYAVESGYNFTSALDGHTFTAAAVDSKTNGNLAMGLGYAYVSSSLSGESRDGNVIRGALSTGHRTKEFSIFAGVGGKYCSLTRGEEDGDAIVGAPDVEYFTLDAGLMAEFAGVFNVGLVGRNLIDSKNVEEAPRSIGIGVGGQFEEFSISGDLNVDLQTEQEAVLSYGVGAQILIQNAVVARFGYNGGGLSKTNYISGGLSYVSKLMGADVAFRQSVDGDSETMVSLGVKVFLP